VTPDIDTLLIALYVEIGDRVIPPGPRRPGQPKRLTDAELVCLAVAQVLLGARSEHHWLRMCYARLGHLFPYLPHQPGYHKRLKAAAPLLAAAIDHLARQCPSWHDQVRLIDATAVPCGASRETVKRSELAGWAHYGYCAAHSRWYWGLKLYLITTPDGMPVAWCLADPKLGEREVAARAPHGKAGRLMPGRSAAAMLPSRHHRCLSTQSRRADGAYPLGFPLPGGLSWFVYGGWPPDGTSQVTLCPVLTAGGDEGY
jgi:hypothetical protein